MLESLLRKMASVAAVFIGLGYVLPSIATIIMLYYSSSQYPIESAENIYWFSGIMIFVIAFIILTALGVTIVFAGLRYFVGTVSERAIFAGVILSSVYLLCLGTGSALVLQEVNLYNSLLTATAILVMASAVVYMFSSFRLKFVGCLLGILSGILLSTVTLNSPLLDLVLRWDAPFPGPFMLMSVLEGLTIMLISVAALVYSVLGNGKNLLGHAFLSIVALVYGMGVFVGSLVLSLNFLNLVWKAPWELALYGKPDWVLNTVIYWAASLGMLGIGGIVSILSAFVGFLFVAEKFSRP